MIRSSPSSLVVFAVLAALAAPARAEPPAAPPGSTSPGSTVPGASPSGALAGLPARGLAAAIQEAGRIEVPAVEPTQEMTIHAGQASRWAEGGYDVWHLTGGVSIVQGGVEAKAHEAVAWIERDGGEARPTADDDGQRAAPTQRTILVRMAGDVAVSSQGAANADATIRGPRWAGRFHVVRDPKLDFTSIVPASARPAVYEAAAEGASTEGDPAGDEAVLQAQFSEYGQTPGAAVVPPAQVARRLRAFPRSSAPLNAQWFPSPSGTEWIGVITSGVNLVVDGVDPAGPLDISADRVVIWTQAQAQPDLQGNSSQSADTPLELYMEGNVIFRQGQRVVEAMSMYYDVPRSAGQITGAMMLTPVENYAGLVRLRADVIQQLDRSRFIASNAGLTSSRLGEPSWEFRSREIQFTDEQVPLPGPFGQTAVDPGTGEPAVEHQQFITSRSNTIRMLGVPVLWWPTFATTAKKPTFYINGLQLKNDQIFGTQVLTSWDAFQVFGIRRQPDGVDWDFDVDYLSLRGPAAGTSLLYNRPQFILGTPANGVLDGWFINDGGIDNVGLYRRDLDFPNSFRGRTFWRHRQNLGSDWQLRGTAGWISDYNFLEEYYESEWEEGYEQRTWLDIRRPIDNRELRLLTSVRVDPFFTQTEWWPRLDHYFLGQPLLNDSVSWYAHSGAAYARQQLPQAPAQNQGGDFFTLLPYEANVLGERFTTRQELDLPFQAGVVKFVPYALGELGHWGQSISATDPNTPGGAINRAYGQVGIRSSVPFWTADNDVESQLWNVHGLAHKVVFDLDFSYAQSTQPINRFPLWDQIDDDAINQYRRNIPYWDFNAPFGSGAISPLQPPFMFGPDNKYDPRTYAIRRGSGDWVTGPTELVDDLTAFRLGLRQRWQTKRGPIGNRRIIDWITFDVDGEVFPTSSQNFGQAMGLWQYDFKWHVGDRTVLLSTADVDFFDRGQQLYTVGAMLNRTSRGSLYLGYNSFAGPIDASVLVGSYTYRMSPKWASSFGGAVDLTGRNIGQQFQLVRIGESFLMTFGFNVDYSRQNVGVTFNLLPRFLSQTQFATRGSSLEVPMAGAYGLE